MRFHRSHFRVEPVQAEISPKFHFRNSRALSDIWTGKTLLESDLRSPCPLYYLMMARMSLVPDSESPRNGCVGLLCMFEESSGPILISNSVEESPMN